MNARPVHEEGPALNGRSVARPSWELCMTDQCHVSTVRRAVRGVLNTAVSERLADDVVLVVSELISNTYPHDQDARLLRISLQSTGVRLEVRGADASPTLNQETASTTTLVLDRLCACWGVLASPNGTSETWAVLAINVG